MEPGFRRRLTEAFTQEEILAYVRKSVRRLENLFFKSTQLNSQINIDRIDNQIEQRKQALQETMDNLTPENYRLAFSTILSPFIQNYIRKPVGSRYSASSTPFQLPTPTAPIANIGNLPPLRPFNNNTRRRIAANIAARNALPPIPPLIRVTPLPNIGNLPPLRPFNNNTRRRIAANIAARNAPMPPLVRVTPEPMIGNLPPLRPFNNNTRRRMNANRAARNNRNLRTSLKTNY